MSQERLFSVIVPVYNREKCLNASASSVLEQSFGDWELILVDDCSTDSSLEVINALAAKDSRVRAVRQPVNGGASAARNSGLEIANGKYVLFLDSDDELAQGTLEVLSEVVRSEPELVVFDYARRNAAGVFDVIPADKIKTREYGRETIEAEILPQHLNVKPKNEYFFQPFTCNKCFRMDVLRREKIFFDAKKRMWEDGEFVIAFLAHTSRLIHVNGLFLQIDAAETGEVKHLSKGYTANLAVNYLEQTRTLFGKWGSKYDFGTQYALREHYDAFIFVMFKTAMYDADSKRIIMSLLGDELVQRIICGTEARSRFERSLKKWVSRGRISVAYGYIVGWALVKKAIAAIRSLKG